MNVAKLFGEVELIGDPIYYGHMKGWYGGCGSVGWDGMGWDGMGWGVGIAICVECDGRQRHVHNFRAHA
jgi:hypothetical protein